MTTTSRRVHPMLEGEYALLLASRVVPLTWAELKDDGWLQIGADLSASEALIVPTTVLQDRGVALASRVSLLYNGTLCENLHDAPFEASLVHDGHVDWWSQRGESAVITYDSYLEEEVEEIHHATRLAPDAPAACMTEFKVACSLLHERYGVLLVLCGRVVRHRIEAGGDVTRGSVYDQIELQRVSLFIEIEDFQELIDGDESETDRLCEWFNVTQIVGDLELLHAHYAQTFDALGDSAQAVSRVLISNMLEEKPPPPPLIEAQRPRPPSKRKAAPKNRRRGVRGAISRGLKSVRKNVSSAKKKVTATFNEGKAKVKQMKKKVQAAVKKRVGKVAAKVPGAKRLGIGAKKTTGSNKPPAAGGKSAAGGAAAAAGASAGPGGGGGKAPVIPPKPRSSSSNSSGATRLGGGGVAVTASKQLPKPPSTASKGQQHKPQPQQQSHASSGSGSSSGGLSSKLPSLPGKSSSAAGGAPHSTGDSGGSGGGGGSKGGDTGAGSSGGGGGLLGGEAASAGGGGGGMLSPDLSQFGSASNPNDLAGAGQQRLADATSLATGLQAGGNPYMTGPAGSAFGYGSVSGSGFVPVSTGGNGTTSAGGGTNVNNISVVLPSTAVVAATAALPRQVETIGVNLDPDARWSETSSTNWLDEDPRQIEQPFLIKFQFADDYYSADTARKMRLLARYYRDCTGEPLGTEHRQQLEAYLIDEGLSEHEKLVKMAYYLMGNTNL